LIRGQFRRAPRQLDAVHFRHHNVGEQELEGSFAQPLISRQSIVKGNDVIAGRLQRLDEKRRISVSSSAYNLGAMRFATFCAVGLDPARARLSPPFIASIKPHSGKYDVNRDDIGGLAENFMHSGNGTIRNETRRLRFESMNVHFNRTRPPVKSRAGEWRGP